MRSVKRWIEAHLPYWNRSQGKDHIFLALVSESGEMANHSDTLPGQGITCALLTYKPSMWAALAACLLVSYRRA
jgi:hypothetical protein